MLCSDSAPTQDNAAEKAADVPQPGMLIISNAKGYISKHANVIADVFFSLKHQFPRYDNGLEKH